MNEATSAPLSENGHVKELLSLLKANRVDSKELRSVLRYVGAMERQLDAAVVELQAMRRELGDMREAQNHPVRTALQNTVTALETKIDAARERLNALKSGIIEGCKNAVASFKEKGISALNGFMNFFKVKNALLDIRKGMNAAIKSTEKSINRIEAASTEYHEIGRHIKNMARAFAGRETVAETKPVGRLAKAAQAPHQFRKSVVSGMGRGIDAAIAKVGRMEQAAGRVAEKKPSVLENLDILKKHAAKTARESPKPERSNARETAI